MDYKNIEKNHSESFEDPLVVKKSSSKKIAWITAGVICALSLIVSASVSTYAVLRNKKSDTSSDPIITTTSAQTTTNHEIPLNFISRDDWGAEPPRSSNIPKLDLPIKRIIVGHTAGNFCTNQNDCISMVKSIQTQDLSLDDIPYNFLIGGDGRIYEGRGFNYQGQHTQNLDATEYNSIGICIGFIGNYNSTAPSSSQIDVLKNFIDTFIEQEILTEDHVIVLQDDLKYFATKANALNEAMKTLKNFRPLYRIYRREEWNAEKPQASPKTYGKTMNWVLLGHTVTSPCYNLNDCTAKARALQYDAFTRSPPLDDILYNIFFGGDGLVFEGRGWDIIGAHTTNYNDKTIGVGFIGDFSDFPPNQNIIDAMVQVFDDAMILGKLTEDYKIFGRSDFGGAGPGAAFMNIIRGLCRYGNRTSPCDQNSSSTTLTTTTPSLSESSTVQRATIPYPMIPPYLSMRDAWGADLPRSSNIPMLDLPIKRIIIAHTGGSYCTTQNDCIAAVKSIQTQDSSLDDIAYNFLLGEDGNIYEGRGFNYQGQHTQNLDATEYNSIGICIAFIGNYHSKVPTISQIEILKAFIQTFVEFELIAEDHIIVSQDDLKYFPTKADALNEIISTFDNFRPLYKIYRREEWNAGRFRGTPDEFDRIMDWVLIGHTVTPLCNDLAACKSRARSLQDYSFGLDYGDILYNIFFGGDGYVFEGRGWDVFGAHARGFNDKSIGVGVIGDFTSIPPNQKIIDAMLRVFDDARALGKLTDDYVIFGRSDFGGPGPGAAFMKIIKEWCRHGNRTNPCSSSTTTPFEEMTTTPSEEITTTPSSEHSTMDGLTTSSEQSTAEGETTSSEFSTTDRVITSHYVTRYEWGAQPPRSSNISKLDLPIKRIITGHTGGNFCTNQNDCISTVKSIQTEDSSLDDIPYNFLVGGDGRIYEGRGFNYQGQHTQNLDATEYNSIGICIGFIGNYNSIVPSSSQIDVLIDFIDTFIDQGTITEDHVIVLQDDLKYFETNANALNEAIKKLDKFHPLYKIYRREEWNAERFRGTPDKFDRIMDWVLIGHTVTPLCNDLAACVSRARSLQDYSFSLSYGDILYNIFFGGDGYVFEGRGWDVIGAHARGFNDKSIGVGVIGDFASIPPNQKIIDAMLRVFDDAMVLGKLTDDFKIFGRSDFGGPGPGDAFMNIIKEWCRHGNRTISC